ncbi:MAG: hypothetical protein CM15mV51_1140 [uncultured marine virus]|nr:MAG: hypothetical protein CM15mV51_1140 [uncultured marine virus]
MSDLFKVNKISDAELDDNLSNIISDLRRFTGISLSLNYLRNSVLRSVAKNNSEGLDETQQSFVNAYVDEGVFITRRCSRVKKEIGGNIYLYSEEGTLDAID